MIIDQLRHILVTGGDQHLHTLLFGLFGQCADHIVRLDPVDNQQRQPHRPHNGVNRLDLAAQLIGHRRPMGFVLRVDLITESLALGIENHRHMGRIVIVEQTAQHVGHAINRPGRLPFGIGQRRHGMEGTVEIGGAVHQHQQFIVLVRHGIKSLRKNG